MSNQTTKLFLNRNGVWIVSVRQTVDQANEVSKKRCISLNYEKNHGIFALAPVKQVPMNLFIMYMAGNFNFHFPHYDGRNAAYAATSSNMVY
ncbi:hypothetical protein NQ317_016482 [Molorchus minor]|uniref:ER membrane protein complex subunit 4 n=1 Tax=Molorchus minor TaxID=1323400 RepID=A0ABQ9JGY0_9CUCU|nr:hypothetical protein NQ317_016482 [Molorchus minor]